jgi:hypothetical protein
MKHKMRNTIFSLFLLLLSVSVFGQRVNQEIFCSPNTFLVKPNFEFRHIQKVAVDTFAPYEARWCVKRSKFGARIEIGVSRYHYNQKTKDWLGNHGGPNFNFILTYDKFNLGFRFKPWTVNPNEELSFDGNILPKYASVNPIKLDFYIGYSLDFKHFSLEPYLGLSGNSFTVIKPDELIGIFSIPSVAGFINGVTANKYFRVNRFEYVSIFANIGYSIIDFTKVHNALGKNYFEWSLGIAYKGFFGKKFIEKIE